MPALSVERFLPAVEEELMQICVGLPDVAGELAASLVAAGGKRLRSRLLFWVAAAGGAPEMLAVEAAAVIEALHVASLMHDDVIDDASTRRGVPAAHVLAGRESSVLSGLLLYAAAIGRSAHLGERAHWLVVSSAATLAQGEMVDCDRAFDEELTTEEYLELAIRKTGALFSLPCSLGSLVGRLPQNLVGRMSQFGAMLGAAFQIVDDCLDLSPTRATGKPTGTDHRRGLYGAPTLLALQSASAPAVRSVLSRAVLSDADLRELHAVVGGAGGYLAAGRLAYDLLENCRELLLTFPAGEPRDALYEITRDLRVEDAVARR